MSHRHPNNKYKKPKQFNFFTGDSIFRYCGGGTLRTKRRGRKARPLSTKDHIHLILKANRKTLANWQIGLRQIKTYQLIQQIQRKYAAKFFIEVKKITIQPDHIHLVIKASRRANYQSFFRVVAGQIAQQLQLRFEMRGARQKNGLVVNQNIKAVSKIAVTDTPRSLWKHQVYTRVIKGYKELLTAFDYLQLNEKEARGEIPYRKQRRKGLTQDEWEGLWV